MRTLNPPLVVGSFILAIVLPPLIYSALVEKEKSVVTTTVSKPKNVGSSAAAQAKPDAPIGDEPNSGQNIEIPPSGNGPVSENQNSSSDGAAQVVEDNPFDDNLWVNRYGAFVNCRLDFRANGKCIRTDDDHDIIGTFDYTINGNKCRLTRWNYETVYNRHGRPFLTRNSKIVETYDGIIRDDGILQTNYVEKFIAIQDIDGTKINYSFSMCPSRIVKAGEEELLARETICFEPEPRPSYNR